MAQAVTLLRKGLLGGTLGDQVISKTSFEQCLRTQVSFHTCSWVSQGLSDRAVNYPAI